MQDMQISRKNCEKTTICHAFHWFQCFSVRFSWFCMICVWFSFILIILNDFHGLSCFSMIVQSFWCVWLFSLDLFSTDVFDFGLSELDGTARHSPTWPSFQAFPGTTRHSHTHTHTHTQPHTHTHLNPKGAPGEAPKRCRHRQTHTHTHTHTEPHNLQLFNKRYQRSMFL